MNPLWITAASSILSSAVASSPAGPSNAGTGGYFDFGDSPFVVNMGPGSASAELAASSPWVGLAIALVVGLVGYKLWKNQSA